MTHEKEITVNTDEIKDHLHLALIEHRYVPIEKEVEIIADILFDYLISKGIVEEDNEDL